MTEENTGNGVYMTLQLNAECRDRLESMYENQDPKLMDFMKQFDITNIDFNPLEEKIRKDE